MNKELTPHAQLCLLACVSTMREIIEREQPPDPHRPKEVLPILRMLEADLKTHRVCLVERETAYGNPQTN